MHIIGLTGSIASGKTTISQIFEDCSIAVFDADKVVNQIFTHDNIIKEKLYKIFGTIDKTEISKYAFTNQQKLNKLEKILHPIVYARLLAFIKEHKEANHQMIVLSIPLLYEVGWDKICEAVIYLHSPEHIRKKRALTRNNLTEKKFNIISILQNKLSTSKMSSKYVIDTSKDLETTNGIIKEIINEYIST